MELKKLQLLVMVILILLLRLPPLHPAANTDIYEEPNATDSKEKAAELGGFERVVSVNRKGGGGGRGGGGGGHSFGGRARGNGNNGYKRSIPLYAAGALPHRQHHGSNHAPLNNVCPTNLVLLLLVITLVQCFV